MNKPAAIAAQLVDIRNVGTHKVVKLTIHVPAEQAEHVFAAFGWPTGVDPVPVAIARLKPESEVVQDRKGSSREPNQPPDKTPPHQTDDQDKPSPGGAKRSWDEMSAAQQAGFLCKLPPFQKFLSEQYQDGFPIDDAAESVRNLCGVTSRSLIDDNEEAMRRWRDIVADYRVWERALV